VKTASVKCKAKGSTFYGVLEKINQHKIAFNVGSRSFIFCLLQSNVRSISTNDLKAVLGKPYGIVSGATSLTWPGSAFPSEIRHVPFVGGAADSDEYPHQARRRAEGWGGPEGHVFQDPKGTRSRRRQYRRRHPRPPYAPPTRPGSGSAARAAIGCGPCARAPAGAPRRCRRSTGAAARAANPQDCGAATFRRRG